MNDEKAFWATIRFLTGQAVFLAFSAPDGDGVCLDIPVFGLRTTIKDLRARLRAMLIY